MLFIAKEFHMIANSNWNPNPDKEDAKRQPAEICLYYGCYFLSICAYVRAK